jgi:transmembrane 9 superfamily protein 2/4
MIIYHIMQAGWNSEYYTLFSALVLGFILLIIVCTLISIIFIYAQLCQGNYVWWWKSFVISGSIAFYVAVYSVFYFFERVPTGRFTSIILYYGSMFFASLSLFLITGSIGFLCTFVFLKKIYSLIKVD